MKTKPDTDKDDPSNEQPEPEDVQQDMYDFRENVVDGYWDEWYKEDQVPYMLVWE